MFFWIVDDRSSFFFNHLKRAFFLLYTKFLIVCFINNWNMFSKLLNKTRMRNEINHQLTNSKIKNSIRRKSCDKQYQSQTRSIINWIKMHDAKMTQLCFLTCVLILRCQNNCCVNIFIVTKLFNNNRLFENKNVIMKICFLMFYNIFYVRVSV